MYEVRIDLRQTLQNLLDYTKAWRNGAWESSVGARLLMRVQPDCDAELGGKIHGFTTLRRKIVRLPRDPTGRPVHELTYGSPRNEVGLEDLLLTASLSAPESRGEGEFVVEVTIKRPTGVKPSSLLAKRWSRFLGEEIIPFDADARSALIEKARTRDELARHIDAWERMLSPAKGKRTSRSRSRRSRGRRGRKRAD